MQTYSRFGLIPFFLLLTIHAWAAVVLPDLFSDHMVLQRQQRIPVWGTAAPGEQVVVSFNNQTQQAIADAQGNWKVYLGPFQANTMPGTLVVSASNRIALHDILVGEVWFCSGQSNMQWTLEQSAGGSEAITQADFPQIRLFNVSREVAFNRKPGKLANWQVCTPESVRDFSGIGYFFGLELFKALGVPVGLINASYGGSQAEAWTPVEYLAEHPALQPCIDRERHRYGDLEASRCACTCRGEANTCSPQSSGCTAGLSNRSIYLRSYGGTPYSVWNSRCVVVSGRI
jgi:sialate O-acetylesterase